MARLVRISKVKLNQKFFHCCMEDLKTDSKSLSTFGRDVYVRGPFDRSLCMYFISPVCVSTPCFYLPSNSLVLID